MRSSARRASGDRCRELEGDLLQQHKRSRFFVATRAVGKVGPADWDQGVSRKHGVTAGGAGRAASAPSRQPHRR